MQFAVVGDGPNRADMEARLPRGRTIFLGHLSGEELATVYASADIYFFPSHTEAFPNTMLEAQASALTFFAPGQPRAHARAQPSSRRAKKSESAPSALLSLARARARAPPVALADASARVRARLHELVAASDVRARIAGNAVRARARGRTWERAFAELVKCYDRCATKGKLADAARVRGRAAAAGGARAQADRAAPDATAASADLRRWRRGAAPAQPSGGSPRAGAWGVRAVGPGL